VGRGSKEKAPGIGNPVELRRRGRDRGHRAGTLLANHRGRARSGPRSWARPGAQLGPGPRARSWSRCSPISAAVCSQGLVPSHPAPARPRRLREPGHATGAVRRAVPGPCARSWAAVELGESIERPSPGSPRCSTITAGSAGIERPELGGRVPCAARRAVPGRAVSGNLGTDRLSCPCCVAWCRFPAVGTARNRNRLTMARGRWRGRACPGLDDHRGLVPWRCSPMTPGSELGRVAGASRGSRSSWAPCRRCCGRGPGARARSPRPCAPRSAHSRSLGNVRACWAA
jgi:hypothetical protein